MRKSIYDLDSDLSKRMELVALGKAWDDAGMDYLEAAAKAARLLAIANNARDAYIAAGGDAKPV
jgi:hypothetical protein